MFHDFQNQLISKAPATGMSPDVWDTGRFGGSDISIGCNISGLIVPTLVTTPGTLTVNIIQSTLSTMAAPDVIATKTFAIGALDVDKQLEVVMGQGVISKQYIAFSFSGTAVINASGFLVKSEDIAVNKFFPKVYASL
jgi:hypothetical protein